MKQATLDCSPSLCSLFCLCSSAATLHRPPVSCPDGYEAHCRMMSPHLSLYRPESETPDWPAGSVQKTCLDANKTIDLKMPLLLLPWQYSTQPLSSAGFASIQGRRDCLEHIIHHQVCWVLPVIVPTLEDTRAHQCRHPRPPCTSHTATARSVAGLHGRF